MGRFAGIEKAEVSRSGVYVIPGVYRFEILKVQSKVTRKQVGNFIVDLRVLESSNPARPVGSVCTWYVGFDKEPAMGNVKSFLSVATDTPESEVDEAGAEMACSAENPLKGIILRASAINIKTKAARDFTQVTWLSDSVGGAMATQLQQSDQAQADAQAAAVQ